MLKFALVGFGGLGKIHFKNLLSLEREYGNIELVAICGADRKTLTQNSTINIGNTNLENIDFSKYHLYDTIDELIRNEKLDFVICALPTVMHADSSVTFLENDIDVFSEKPMALSYADCQKMVEAAETHGRILMIGQCLRFNGAYQKVREYINTGIYGKTYRAEFMRYSQLPTWTFNSWILDRKQSGGCPLDMHVHDVDLINAFFGMPNSVSSYATHNRNEFESIFTTYEYDNILVSSAADWSFPQTFPFESRLRVLFENAAAVISGNDLTVYTDNKTITPEIDTEDHFKKEIREFIKCCHSRKQSIISDCYSVMNSIKIVEAEIASAQKNGEMIRL